MAGKMQSDTNVRENRRDKERTYEKPQLRVIELATEEVLGFGCKLVSGGRASGAVPCHANGCNAAAS